jgi:hypothetical protein
MTSFSSHKKALHSRQDRTRMLTLLPEGRDLKKMASRDVTALQLPVYEIR